MGWPTRLFRPSARLRRRADSGDRRARLRDQPPALGRRAGRRLDCRRATSTSSRRPRRCGFPWLGAYLRWHGTIAVRRGEGDRDAVRMMREAARDGHVVGLFVEGTRQTHGRPGTAQPGAAMVAMQEDVPVVPVAVYGTQFWKLGNFKPCSVAYRRAGPLRRAAEGRKGLQGGDRGDRAPNQRPLRLARRRPRTGPPAGSTPPL